VLDAPREGWRAQRHWPCGCAEVPPRASVCMALLSPLRQRNLSTARQDG
jgi:hypothetical protein